MIGVDIVVKLRYIRVGYGQSREADLVIKLNSPIIIPGHVQSRPKSLSIQTRLKDR